MRLATWRTQSDRTGWLRRLVTLVLAALLVGSLNIAGCPQPQYTQMIEGVTLQDIRDIQTNADLDASEKEQALEDLGITDEQLVTLFLNAPLPPADD